MTTRNDITGDSICSRPTSKAYAEQWERIFGSPVPFDKPINQKYLNECFEYSPDTGELKWRERPISHFKNKMAAKRWNARFCGVKAGSTIRNGNKEYRNICLCDKQYLAHRAIWVMVYGSHPNAIDHINGDGLDNRLENLRSVDNAQNAKNMKLFNTSTTGICGVSWNKANKRWTSEIMANGVRYFLGSFDNIIDAASARLRANKKFGFHENHGIKRD